MSVTRCISSQLMSELLAWRNPQGSEDDWFGPSQGIQRVDNVGIHVGKVAAAEIGLCLLTVASLVETVAYATLALVSLALYPVTEKPYNFFAKRLESSSFTIIWGIADAIFYNPLVVNVLTRESFARYWAAMLNPTPIVLFRLSDMLDLADWVQHQIQITVDDSMLQPIYDIGRATQEVIDQGANFIVQEVLSGANDNTLTLFKDGDPSIFIFILTKAVYIYVAGSKKKAPLPNYFKAATKNLILSLRQEQMNDEVLKQLQELLTDTAKFEKGPEDEAVRSTFNKLRNVASGELQSSLFITRCFQKATEML